MIRLGGLRDDYVSGQSLVACQIVCTVMDLFGLSPYVFASGPRQKICSYVFERVIFFVDFDLVYIAGLSIAAELLPATQASAVYLVMTKEMKLRNCEMRDALPGARAAS